MTESSESEIDPLFEALAQDMADELRVTTRALRNAHGDGLPFTRRTIEGRMRVVYDLETTFRWWAAKRPNPGYCRGWRCGGEPCTEKGQSVCEFGCFRPPRVPRF